MKNLSAVANIQELQNILIELKEQGINHLNQFTNEQNNQTYFQELVNSPLVMTGKVAEILETIRANNMHFDINDLNDDSIARLFVNNNDLHRSDIQKEHEIVVKILKDSFNLNAKTIISHPDQTIFTKFIGKMNLARIEKTLEKLLDMDLVPLAQQVQDIRFLSEDAARAIVSTIRVNKHDFSTLHLTEVLKFLTAKKVDATNLFAHDIEQKFMFNECMATIKAFNDANVKINFYAPSAKPDLNILEAILMKTQHDYVDSSRIKEIYEFMQAISGHDVDFAKVFNNPANINPNIKVNTLAEYPFAIINARNHMALSPKDQISSLVLFTEFFGSKNIDFSIQSQQHDPNSYSCLDHIIAISNHRHNTKILTKVILNNIAKTTPFKKLFDAAGGLANIKDIIKAYQDSDQGIDFNTEEDNHIQPINNPAGNVNMNAHHNLPQQNTLLQKIFTHINDQATLKSVMKYLQKYPHINWNQNLTYQNTQKSIIDILSIIHNNESDLLKLLQIAKEEYKIEINFNNYASLENILNYAKEKNLDIATLVDTLKQDDINLNEGLLLVLYAQENNVSLSEALVVYGKDKVDFTKITSAQDLKIISNKVTNAATQGLFQASASIKFLQNAGFDQWNADFGNGNNFLMQALENNNHVVIKNLLNIAKGTEILDLEHQNNNGQNIIDIIKSKKNQIGYAQYTGIIKFIINAIPQEEKDVTEFIIQILCDVHQNNMPAGVVNANNNFIDHLINFNELGIFDTLKKLKIDLMHQFQNKSLIEILLGIAIDVNDVATLFKIANENNIKLDLNSEINGKNILTLMKSELVHLEWLQNAIKNINHHPQEQNLVQLEDEEIPENQVNLSKETVMAALAKPDFITDNVKYLIQNTKFDWNDEIKLLFVISQAGLYEAPQLIIQRWNLIQELITKYNDARYTEDGLVFNLNSPEANDKLIDKAHFVMTSANNKDLIVTLQKVIATLRNYGAVEPKENIGFFLNKEGLESAQSYSVLPKLSKMLQDKYPQINIDNAHDLQNAIDELKQAMEQYVQEEYKPEDRQAILNGIGEGHDASTGLTKEVDRLCNLPMQHQYQAKFDWMPKVELARLWMCAKESDLQKEFFAIFSGLNACEWGRLVNLYIPLVGAISGKSLNRVDYNKEDLLKDIIAVIDKKLPDIINKLFDEKDKLKFISEAFNTYDSDPTEWAITTQMLIGACNFVFGSEIKDILKNHGQQLEEGDLIESYHYNSLLRFALTRMIHDSNKYPSDIVAFVNEGKAQISKEIIEALKLSNALNSFGDIIENAKEQYGDFLVDLSVIAKEDMDDLCKAIGKERELQLFKALNKNRIGLNEEFKDYMQKILNDAQIHDFELAVKVMFSKGLIQLDKSLMNQFKKDWQLNTKTLKHILDNEIQDSMKVQLLLKELSDRQYKKTQDASRYVHSTLSKVKITNANKMIEELLDKPKNTKSIIDDFAKILGKIQLETEQVIQLLNTCNKELVHELVTHKDLVISWIIPQDGKDHTLLHILAHMGHEGYEAAISLYQSHEEEWQTIIHHDINDNYETFGDLIGNV